MIFFGCLDDDIDDVGEAAAATTTLFHGVIDLRRNNKLPTILIEKLVDDFADFVVSYVIAAADKHVFIPNMTFTIVFSAKEDGGCQEKIEIESMRLVVPRSHGRVRFGVNSRISLPILQAPRKNCGHSSPRDLGGGTTAVGEQTGHGPCRFSSKQVTIQQVETILIGPDRIASMMQIAEGRPGNVLVARQHQ
ncbi:hypothetical protein HGP14_21030 [Rhizobium sp. P32RR-XVIII]|nr:hypothetical protein [Rhizobium sp. P32RR-XVIII]